MKWITGKKIKTNLIWAFARQDDLTVNSAFFFTSHSKA